MSLATNLEEETSLIQELTSKFDDLITSTGTIHHAVKHQAAFLLNRGRMTLTYIEDLLSSKLSPSAQKIKIVFHAPS